MYFNIYAIPPLITDILILAIGLFVFFKNKTAAVNKQFFYFCISLFGWLLGFVLMYFSNDPVKGLIFVKIGFTFTYFVPICIFHFSVSILNLVSKYKKFLLFLYCSSIPFIVLGWKTSTIYAGLSNRYWGFYPIAGKYYFLVVILTGFLFLYSAVLLFKGSIAAKRRGEIALFYQINYVFFAVLVGTTGIIDYIIKYGISFYPTAYISALGFISLIAYAIVRYRLMDIRLAVTKAGLFVLIYALVLGIPFLVGKYFTHNWFVPTALAVVLASFGPFIYSRLRQGAENRILAEQKRNQESLLQIAKQLTHIKEKDKLVEFVCDAVYKLMNLSKVSIYTLDETSSADASSALRIADDASAELVIDIGHEEVLGRIELGAKLDGAGFSEDDVSILNIIAEQCALALENVIYLQREKQRIIQQEAEAKARSLDVMIGSLAHEIQNPLAGAIGNLDVLNEIMSGDLDEGSRVAVKESLKYVNEPLKRVSKMIAVLHNYSKGYSTNDFQTFDVIDALNDFKVLVQARLKRENLEINYEVGENLPKIKGVSVWIQEALMNFVSNSIHALKNVQDKKLIIRVNLQATPGVTERFIRIECEDNGYGIAPHMLKEIFHPFVTTKSTSEGTGLGLSIVSRHVAEMGGIISVESAGIGKGAKFWVEVPVVGCN
ncbi:MAG: hypothetical protein HQL25_06600 [Candidatus Omnitrophica bacterium]|nr:hypothetical protein [Candidatus Omnitrophota bacterium]